MKMCYQHGCVALICLLLFVFMLNCPDQASGAPCPGVGPSVSHSRPSLLSGITSCSRICPAFFIPDLESAI